ncbi:hypothetical protein JOB18_008345 [Solea senegalensis]|uniref:Uncharacterized protein n=1 Tax=Solea senegalensis TaxID=28829 RepID=A0AAV6T3W6_SOLSE|nr:hypothetical protein JOB18_008345 [Solea senegalensis]
MRVLVFVFVCLSPSPPPLHSVTSAGPAYLPLHTCPAAAIKPPGFHQLITQSALSSCPYLQSLPDRHSVYTSFLPARLPAQPSPQALQPSSPLPPDQHPSFPAFPHLK